MCLVVHYRQTCRTVDETLSIGGALEILANDGAVVLAHLGTYADTAPGGLLQLEVVHALNERAHLVLVLREVQSCIPGKALVVEHATVEGYLYTPVLYLASIDQPVTVAGS